MKKTKNEDMPADDGEPSRPATARMDAPAPRVPILFLVPVVLGCGLVILFMPGLGAAEFRQSGTLMKACRFFSLEDAFLRDAVLGTVLLGLNCGVLGTLLVSRRMAMLADTLSHAVLPGIAAGFLWSLTKNPVALVCGAIATGVLSSLMVSWITHTTRLKADAALSVVLTVFFAAGIALIKMISNAFPGANKAGLDRFLYGQTAGISGGDVVMLAVTAGITLATLIIGYRGFLVLAFDETFGRAAGLPVRVLHYVQMFLTTLAIVVSMEAVGVILVAGLLVIPASTAWLFSRRLRHILWLSALLGMAAAVLGNFTAFVITPKGGGSVLVLCAGLIFAAAFLFSPDGVARRAWRWLQHGRRIRREDTLKAIYRLLESRDFAPGEVHAGEAGCTPGDLRTLLRHGLGSGSAQSFTLTPAGFREAARMVRNHRLWELYLTQRAGYAQDHVHDSAEQMEHLLAEENIAHMMEVLGHPATDPHGKRIPSLDDAPPRHE
jgi:ABC-type Mn2+/Zn2+ transport system permease subunit/Mn-dependent DtxR family transcriptional regulator